MWDVCGDTTGLFSCTLCTCSRQRVRGNAQTGVSKVCLEESSEWGNCKSCLVLTAHKSNLSKL